jgi:hypothetical protein
MPVTYQIDAGRSLVTTIVVGNVSPADMHAYQSDLRADPAFSPDFDGVTDFTDAEPFEGTSDDIRRLVAELPFNPGTRRAYVAPIDLHFGLSRMAQVYAETKGVIVEVFRDRAAALAWLGRE